MVKVKKQKIGRPPLGKKAMTEQLMIRATKDQRKSWESTAKKNKSGFSNWARETLDRASAR